MINSAQPPSPDLVPNDSPGPGAEHWTSTGQAGLSDRGGRDVVSARAPVRAGGARR